ncbi:unnamed protein product, partial [Rotaria sordida]
LLQVQTLEATVTVIEIVHQFINCTFGGIQAY